VRGTSGALAFMLGLSIGDVAWLTAAVLGLAFIAKTFALAFLVVKYLGAAYLLYLAWRMWRTSGDSHEVEEPKAERPLRLFLTGLSLTLGNPKTMVFYVALLPNLLDLASLTVAGYAALVVVTLAVCTVVDGGYIILAARARRLFRSARAMRFVNRGAGALMAGAAAAVVTR
jgi:threonine/homoserine/homoserine lactone efflux protein